MHVVEPPSTASDLGCRASQTSLHQTPAVRTPCHPHLTLHTHPARPARLQEGYPITDVRGRGLMVAAEFGGAGAGMAAKPGVAAAVTQACGRRGMLLLTAGARLGARGPGA